VTAQNQTATTLSVVIPLYNDERTLRLCLQAVYAQDREPDEVVVVDDCSTDGSAAILRDFPCRVVRLEVNSGPAAARNRGVRETTGEIVFFLDADVALASDALANALEQLDRHPEYACVHGNYDTVPMIGGGAVERYRVLHAHHWRAISVGRVPTVIFALCAIRRTVLEELGPLDERLRAAEDVEYSDRMGPDHPILLSGAVVGRHDDESELLPMLAKQFRRSQWVIPVAAAERGPSGLHANRRRGLLAAALTVLSAPLALLWLPLAVVPALFLVVFLCADPGLIRLAVREGGRRFTVVFVAVHFLVQLAIVSGVAFGGIRWMVDPDFAPEHSARRGRRGGRGRKGGRGGRDAEAPGAVATITLSSREPDRAERPTAGRRG
jgi:hypothetical protein